MVGPLKPKQISTIAMLAAIYVVLSFIPVSMFIGAQSFLSLSLIITPVLAVVFHPFEALISSSIGGFIILILNPGNAMFGIFTMMLPIAGAVCGSLNFHYKRGSLPVIAFLASTIVFYLYSRGAFIYWIIPHCLAIVFIIAGKLVRRDELNIFISSFIATMCEQSAMLLLAINILKLPAFIFQVAFPLMLYERIFAAIGGTIILITLTKIEPSLTVYFPKKVGDN